MKKVIAFVVILISLSYCSCNKCGSGDNPTDPHISSCFFKVGSYFIYNDTTDHIIDSQYVFQYSYQPNFIPIMYDMCTEYDNQYQMWETSFRKGLFYDTIATKANDPYNLCWSQTEGVISSNCYNPTYDTLINNFMMGGHVYPTVYIDLGGERLSEGTIVGTDLYIATGYGIIKRVEHRLTGDVSWDLIRYHIVQ